MPDFGEPRHEKGAHCAPVVVILAMDYLTTGPIIMTI